MFTKYFFEMTPRESDLLGNRALQCTLAAVLDDSHCWMISWLCDSEGNKLPDRHEINSSKLTEEMRVRLELFREIEAEEIGNCPGADVEFISWALSGYRNYLYRMAALVGNRRRAPRNVDISQ